MQFDLRGCLMQCPALLLADGFAENLHEGDTSAGGVHLGAQIHRLGIERNEKKKRRLQKWVSPREIARFNRLCRAVHLAAPPARFHLREICQARTSRKSWGAHVKLSRQAWKDLEQGSRLGAGGRQNGRGICPTTAPATDSLHMNPALFTWEGVLNLRESGFAEQRQTRMLHNTPRARSHRTHSAGLSAGAEGADGAVTKQQSGTGSLAHCTSRDPALMRRMRRLWIILDLHGIELLDF
ncbi:hypothetical protein CYMTET_52105 [Cymbomonas tetramitiformis]|uniref:Uncharacterized protein n=1 Tax=Cymbomonas tetramitiformis TaxID=36881 RepID=A0AAE0ERF0_9CHLO|nr:hypothetical protein CYMTET_52105 [Cymbomonas tetramitiformis]